MARGEIVRLKGLARLEGLEELEELTGHAEFKVTLASENESRS